MAEGEGYRLNSRISSRILAGLLDIGVSNANARVIMKYLFRVDLLVGLEKILVATSLGKGIPRPRYLRLLEDPNALVKYYPFLLDVSGLALVEHQRLASVGAEFLRKKSHLIVVLSSAWK